MKNHFRIMCVAIFATFFLICLNGMEQVSRINKSADPLTINTKDNRKIKLNKELAGLTSRLGFLYFNDGIRSENIKDELNEIDGESVNSVFAHDQEKIWDLTNSEQFNKATISLRAFLCLKKLLRYVMAFKNHKLSEKKLEEKFNNFSFARKIDCIILADFLNILDLKDTFFIKTLARFFESKNYICSFSNNYEFFKILRRLNIPSLSNPAAIEIISQHFNKFNDFFKQFIKRKNLMNHWPKNCHINSFEEEQNAVIAYRDKIIERDRYDENFEIKLGVDKMCHENSINNFSISPNNRLLASTINEMPVYKIVDRPEIKTDNKLLASSVKEISVHKNVDKQEIKTELLDNANLSTIYVWSMKETKKLQKIEIPDFVSNLAFNKESNKLAALTYNSKVYVYDLLLNESNELEAKLIKVLKFEKSLNGFVSFNKASTGIIIATMDGQILEKDILTENLVKNLKQTEPIKICAMHPNHQKILTYSNINRKIYLWNLIEQNIQGSISLPRDISEFVFNSHANYVIAKANGGIYLIDLRSCKPLLFFNCTNIDSLTPINEDKLLICRATRKPQIQKINLTRLINFLYANDQLYPHIVLLMSIFFSKKFDLSKAKPHIQELFKTLPRDFQNYLDPQDI